MVDMVLHDKMEPIHYTVKQFSQLFGIHYQTTVRYCEKGQIHAFKVGRVWRISQEEVKDFELRLRAKMKKNGR